jgi:uncharacterized protein (TIGR00251 family)
VTFRVRLTPRASRDVVVGERAGILLVRLTAPPVDGAANGALVRFLSKWLGVRPSAVSIVSGEKSRIKTVFVAGLDASRLQSLLERP